MPATTETTSKDQVRKIIISVLLGLTGFVASYFSFNFHVGAFNISIVWGCLFPLIAASAYGTRYGLIAGFWGLSAFYPFLIWPDNGWANVVNSLLFFLWMMWQGHAADKLKSNNRWYWQPVFVQLQFAAVYAYVIFSTYSFLFSLNPAFWAPHSQLFMPVDIIASIIIKENIHLLLMVVLAQFVLSTHPVQRLLKLPVLPECRNNMTILLVSVLAAGINIILWLVVKHSLIEGNSYPGLFSIFNPETISYSLMIFASCVVAGFIVAKNSAKLLLAMNSLNKAEKFNRVLFNSSPVGLSLCTIDGTFVDFNPAFLNIIGRTSDETKMLSYWDITPKKYTEQETLQLRSLAETGSYGAYEKEFVHKDGHLVPVILKGIIVDYDNEHYIWSTIEDITGRKLAEAKLSETNERLTALIEAIPDAIFFKDGEGRWLITNEPAKELFGLRGQDWIGKTDAQLGEEHPQYKSAHQNCFDNDEKAWAAAELTKLDETLTGEHGKSRHFEVSKVPLFHANGKRKALVIVGTDVTERKQAEQALKSALLRAESSDLLKTAFLNNISHEIRTPLNSILGFGQIITDPDLSFADKERFLDILQKSSKRLINTITEYMDISLLVSGNQEVHKTLFAPVDLLNTIYEEFSACCKNNSLTFTQQLIPQDFKFRINSDFGLLQKTMYHLVDNAVKFTREGGIIFGMEAKADSLVFFVKDTGVGIAMESQELIFDKFMQENVSSTRGHEGSGLGLSIVKGNVDLLGGQIWLESQKGQGFSLFFSIPFDIAGNEISAQHPARVDQTGEPIILIAEDEVSNSLFLERMLQSHGFVTLVVVDGRQAVDVCRLNPDISIVLMDLKMPVLDGFDATREIKSFRPSLPVIAVTAFAMRSDEIKALNAGCDDYISKPYSQDALLKKLNKFGVIR